MSTSSLIVTVAALLMSAGLIALHEFGPAEAKAPKKVKAKKVEMPN